ncbi:MAG: AMP-binding protein [Nitrospira sp.]|nr:AMP-binding protein [Nitrospira sp.]
MREVPLLGPYQQDDLLAWGQGVSRTAAQFLSNVYSLADRLPDRPTVLNLAASRYEFLVGFAAAMIRRQVTLLPHSRVPHVLREMVRDYPDSYVYTDHETPSGMSELVPVLSRQSSASECCPPDIPVIPLDQVVAIAFTSGTTGKPVPNRKTWAALISVAQATGARLGIKDREQITVVATVPHQHMFGLEASVMLPIVHGLAMHEGRPLFPADVASVLMEVPGRWLLVTTPIHLRACVAEGVSVPKRGLILSATAPLALEVARRAEQQFQSEVREIFGFAEAGSVAERRTVAGDWWRPLDGVRVEQEGTACVVRASYLPVPVSVPDRLSVSPNGEFIVHGRKADEVHVAGYRVSLGELNSKLLQVEGVQDGVFVMPDEQSGLVTRLMAFVVAPGKRSEEILRALRAHIDPAFLPRPLVCVPKLPRNETGKLPRETIEEMVRWWREEKGRE